ncbi:SEC-C metal-binding domain-containing protein [Metabacillus malikii]|uniref:Zinc chelation protein SecC n=1 Tax=Metabacillus malikii TaxID=1504265 RepID=A0ABT9ZI65_9BACI|nr:SEC-C metal-binding domain-containing protein [Metabacillus malikii]MDQ0230900.1 hypothetical protein [Metabacillus malikii]
MNNFLEKLHPFILSDDLIVQKFVLKAIDKALIGNDMTFELTLKANDKNVPHMMKNSILPYAKGYRIQANGMQMLVDCIKRNDDNLIWYLSILDHCNPELIEEYYEEIKPYIDDNMQEVLMNSIMLSHYSIKELTEKLSTVINEMEEQKFYNGSLFRKSKQIIDTLIKMNGLEQNEVERAIQQEINKKYFSYKGLLSVYAAGEMNIQALVNDLSKLLPRSNEEILLGEIEEALIKIGSNEVITKVAPYVLNNDNYYSPIIILGNIKSEHAIRTLLNLFDQAPDITAKTLIAEALCLQLSTDAIPKIATLIGEGYDHSFLPLEDSLYANCVINGIEHPELQSWKDIIDNREAHYKKREELLNKNSGINHLLTPNFPISSKVGRNEPCPCGSGKKFKKCCGK